jgi:hypothetical protein
MAEVGPTRQRRILTFSPAVRKTPEETPDHRSTQTSFLPPRADSSTYPVHAEGGSWKKLVRRTSSTGGRALVRFRCLNTPVDQRLKPLLAWCVDRKFATGRDDLYGVDSHGWMRACAPLPLGLA